MNLYILLLAGVGIMTVLMALQMKHCSVAWWKSIVVSMSLALTGFLGSELWYFIENLSIGGRSFFGAIFLSPLVFWPIAKFLRIPYGILMDFIPSAGCITLALVKIQCLRDHCCEGRILYMNENYIYVRFPSQLVEMLNFVVLATLLTILSYKSKMRKKIFPCFFILYGITRFVLNSFRDGLTVYALGMPAGHFWAVISIIIGIVWLRIFKVYSRKVLCNEDCND